MSTKEVGDEMRLNSHRSRAMSEPLLAFPKMSTDKNCLRSPVTARLTDSPGAGDALPCA
jgi:hypothetical protein